MGASDRLVGVLYLLAGAVWAPPLPPLTTAGGADTIDPSPEGTTWVYSTVASSSFVPVDLDFRLGEILLGDRLVTAFCSIFFVLDADSVDDSEAVLPGGSGLLLLAFFLSGEGVLNRSARLGFLPGDEGGVPSAL